MAPGRSGTSAEGAWSSAQDGAVSHSRQTLIVARCTEVLLVVSTSYWFGVETTKAATDGCCAMNWSR